MKILYATTNPAKLELMKNFVQGLDIELLCLRDMQGEIPSVTEDGNTPLENARKKAEAYYKAFKMPVFSCDSGLYFENLPEYSPLVHVRNVNGKSLSDDEMIEYYSGLAEKYGDIIARYKNAICFILDENKMFCDDAEDLWGSKFIITNKAHSKRVKGFPLDSLSKCVDNGKYFYDCEEMLTDSIEFGIKRFFKESIKK